MKRFIVALFLASAVVACKEEKPQLTQEQLERQRIDSLETQIKASVQKAENPDIKLAMTAVKQYLYFAKDYPKDSLAPEYLFKAAQIYEGVLNDYPRAAEVYKQVYEAYPEYRKRPMMLFYQANVYHQLQDTSSAILYFKRFADTYPDHPFADDAESMIKFMRMNEADMQKFFEQSADRETAPKAHMP
ncbi:MAG: tetratricopeptide repeat protein [Hymenobacteraceae bacterium]|mgnify:CR=1 FL=1|nr:tetratricopeptide repeat protein [Hymenobacteraceae bacterium]MDX5394955.1 tetratricopeptide repeat protein [Hymenobacteraceae bacterium]MDX5510989.1 tetratricopeptide repeat protein [Hymenobacteraceae bacterium]